MNNELIRELLTHRILIWGAGLEGRSSEQLLKQIGHRHFRLTEDNDWVLAHYRDFDRILISPGISLYQISLANPAHAEIVRSESFRARLTSQTDLFLKYYRDSTVGITGTKGKSTVASLVTHILRDSGHSVELVGNIGRPAFQALLGLESSEPADGTSNVVWVYELSSYQLEFVQHSPRIAVTLNVTEDHISHHGSMAAYRAAKARIAQFKVCGDRHFQFGDALIILGNHPEIAQMPCPLLGQHNLINLAFAYLATQVYPVSDDQFARSVAAFSPLEHRLEFVDVKKEVAYYNDSIATNPAALMAGVHALSIQPPSFTVLSFTESPARPEYELQTLIFGGQNKDLDLSELTEFLRRAQSMNADWQFIALPETGHKIVRALGLSRKFMVPDLPAAVALAAELTEPGRAVLFSPGAASFNQYRDFQDRGQHFKELVNSL
jgi:UDP-N-acetylmuramoylalanine--D-glutamate ligase